MSQSSPQPPGHAHSTFWRGAIVLCKGTCNCACCVRLCGAGHNSSLLEVFLQARGEEIKSKACVSICQSTRLWQHVKRKPLVMQHNATMSRCQLTSMGNSLCNSSAVRKYSTSVMSLMLHVPCLLYSCCQNSSLDPALKAANVHLGHALAHTSRSNKLSLPCAKSHGAHMPGYFSCQSTDTCD